MSLQIPVQKNIGEYQEKIVGKMSLRTLACTAGGFAAAVAVAAFLYLVLGIDVGSATLPVMAAALPFWLAGFWRPFGMKIEEFAPLFLEHALSEQVMFFEGGPAPSALGGCGPVPGKPSRKSRRAVWRKGAELYEAREIRQEASE